MIPESFGSGCACVSGVAVEICINQSSNITIKHDAERWSSSAFDNHREHCCCWKGARKRQLHSYHDLGHGSRQNHVDEGLWDLLLLEEAQHWYKEEAGLRDSVLHHSAHSHCLWHGNWHFAGTNQIIRLLMA